jgi:oligopeptide transport system ATP-binding protein
VSTPLLVHRRRVKKAERRAQAFSMLERVGLAAEIGDRLPHELSGGQAQRVAIARALILEPQILICDEAVAALDSTVRAEVLSLLQQEQRRTSLSLIMITHDLGVVRQMAHRVLVMYAGRVVELASGEQLFRRPQHPYTRSLLDAMPIADPAQEFRAPLLAGEAASAMHPPPGCVFHPRCSYAKANCKKSVPALRVTDDGENACLRYSELDLSQPG